MGLLFPDDPHRDLSDPTIRRTGFERYKQLMSNCAWRWVKVNLLTLLGLLPLAAGIVTAVLSSSILVLLPCSIVGGMIFGPFLAGLYDAILRGLRDDPLPWWQSYRRSWRQNWKDSLLPGAILGLLLGMYSFMACLFWWSQVLPGWGTIVLYLFSAGVLLALSQLYWTQLVLFQQTTAQRLRNCVLFSIKYFWRVAGTALLQLLYWGVHVLFAPWTLLLAPWLSLWYIHFAAGLRLYPQLDEEFDIEGQFNPK